MSREEIALQLASYAGSDVMRLEDPRDGWPSLVGVLVDDKWHRCAFFIAPVGLSNRNRDDVERRFQNPGARRPIELVDGRTPIFVGLWQTDPLLRVESPVAVMVDAMLRLNKVTRFSVFLRLGALVDASRNGWIEERNTTGEQMLYFAPPLLNVASYAKMEGVEVPDRAVSVATEAAAPDWQENAITGERVRRVALSIVRDARFARDVARAYGGTCALCGLGAGLIEAAHIFPAAADQSPDAVWNGVSLCRNHHGAFDRFLIWIDPLTRAVHLHPGLIQSALSDMPTRLFVDSTSAILADPPIVANRPRTEMFALRNDLYRDQYSWMRRRR